MRECRDQSAALPEAAAAARRDIARAAEICVGTRSAPPSRRVASVNGAAPPFAGVVLAIATLSFLNQAGILHLELHASWPGGLAFLGQAGPRRSRACRRAVRKYAWAVGGAAGGQHVADRGERQPERRARARCPAGCGARAARARARRLGLGAAARARRRPAAAPRARGARARVEPRARVQPRRAVRARRVPAEGGLGHAAAARRPRAPAARRRAVRPRLPRPRARRERAPPERRAPRAARALPRRRRLRRADARLRLRRHRPVRAAGPRAQPRPHASTLL